MLPCNHNGAVCYAARVDAELAENVVAGWRQNEPEDARNSPEEEIGTKKFGVRTHFTPPDQQPQLSLKQARG